MKTRLFGVTTPAGLLGRPIGPAGILFLASLLLFTLAALVLPLNRDESQYVAAVELMRHGLPFRDFMYLQTPLQPLLLAPFAFFEEGWLFLTLRLVNALAAAGAILIVYRAALAAGGTPRRALAAAAMLALCDAMIFAGGVARNDTLPLFFETLGIWLLVGTHRGMRHDWRLFLAGLAFGAAVSVKISYIVPAGVLFAVMLYEGRRDRFRGAVAYALGGAVGVLPTLVLFALVPENFLFGVFEYSLVAPQQWRMVNDQAHMLEFGTTLRRLAWFMVQGPALVVLALVLWRRFRHGGDRHGVALDWLIIAGCIAAMLPQPSFRQYVIPILPPLFIRFGAIHGPIAPRRSLQLVFAVTLVLGIWRTGAESVGALRDGSPILLAVADGAWLGDHLDDSGAPGMAASLSPERFAGGRLDIDPRFAMGPFLYRMHGLMTADEERRMHVVTRESLDRAFRNTPPSAIVTGGEGRSTPDAPGGLDAPLKRWAERHNYRRMQSPSGTLSLYLRPGDFGRVGTGG
ncbi:glycosyltransferase 87 family protein [Sphingomonas sp. 3-13AW]|uniref:glycosyltransferase 87 family protein n=1 Tax=Sphingomonas sp. 3-13AW TaxID=3050450 RepID=UPI003BB60831